MKIVGSKLPFGFGEKCEYEYDVTTENGVLPNEMFLEKIVFCTLLAGLIAGIILTF